MQIDRRLALQLFASSSLVHGLGDLLAAPSRPKGPSQQKGEQKKDQQTARPWLQEARRHARATNTPLVALIVPSPGAKPEPMTPELRQEKRQFQSKLRRLLTQRPERDLGKACQNELPGKLGSRIFWTVPFENRHLRCLVYLQLLLENQSYEMRELFMEATFVCVSRDQVKAESSENVLLLDPITGRRIAGIRVSLARATTFLDKVGKLVRGNGRAGKRAKAARTAEIESALGRLDSPNNTERLAARKILAARFDKHRATILEARRELKGARINSALRAIVLEAHTKAQQKGFGGPMPFGTRLQEQHVYDPCPPCGMARIPAASRKLLRFLGST